MVEPHQPNLIAFAGLLAVLFCTAAIVDARIPQQSPATPADETSRAISLYQQGQNEEAIASLRAVVKRNKNELTAWHYLGLALEKKGDAKGALDAHESAAKLGDKLLDAQLVQAASGEDVSQVIAPIRSFLSQAADSSAEYLKLNPKLSKSKREEWELRNSSLRGFADIDSVNSGIGPVFRARDVDTKARILSKPIPDYTGDALKNQTTGTVVLRAILTSYGKVVAIRVVGSLPDGLTEAAIRSARKLKFVPAIKDGRPVSMFIQLEYSFN